MSGSVWFRERSCQLSSQLIDFINEASLNDNDLNFIIETSFTIWFGIFYCHYIISTDSKVFVKYYVVKLDTCIWIFFYDLILSFLLSLCFFQRFDYFTIRLIFVLIFYNNPCRQIIRSTGEWLPSVMDVSNTRDSVKSLSITVCFSIKISSVDYILFHTEQANCILKSGLLFG